MGSRQRQQETTTKERQPARDVNRAERLRAAIALRKAGHEWETIAEQCGIPGGKSGAYHLVNRAMKHAIREDIEDLRAWEDARLNELLTVYWPKAMQGDGWSFDRVLRLMERRASLLGLNAPTKVEDVSAGPLIVYEAFPAPWLRLPGLPAEVADAAGPSPSITAAPHAGADDTNGQAVMLQ